MWWLDSSDMVLVLGASGACLTGLVVAWCQQQRKSRCSSINICCGVVKCSRTVESDELVLAEEANERNQRQTNSVPSRGEPDEIETVPTDI